MLRALRYHNPKLLASNFVATFPPLLDQNSPFCSSQVGVFVEMLSSPFTLAKNARLQAGEVECPKISYNYF